MQHLSAGRARLLMSSWLLLSSLTATGVSWLLLHGMAMSSLPLRYAMATVAGWAMLATCVVVWRRLQRRVARRHETRDGWLDGADLLPDVTTQAFSGPSSAPSSTSFDGFGGGGGFSGGGGGTSWGAEGPDAAGDAAPPASALLQGPRGLPSSGASSSSSSSGLGDVVSGLGDADEALPLVIGAVLVAVVLSALVASGLLIVGAPALLGEVLLEAALLAPAAGPMRRDLSSTDVTPQVLRVVVRHTWKPMLAIGLTLVIGGAIAQGVCPPARSARDLVRAIQTPGSCAAPALRPPTSR